MKQELTVIIPFLNEGEEIKNTVDSIRTTTNHNVHIILINDCSTDCYDYQKISKSYNCKYINHTERQGVANSRNEGVNQCQTRYFLLLDGHMRFYEKDWDNHLLELLKKYPRALLCGRSKELRFNEKNEIIDTVEPKTYGAYIEIFGKSFFNAAWNYCDNQPFAHLSEIPCILGATYAMSKDYWQLLRGVEGLLTYGTDEELLSMKVWLEGGKCLLVKDWIVGHIYRNRFPYQIYDKEIIYNKLYVIELLLPYKEKSALFRQMKNAYGQIFSEAYILLQQNYKHIIEMKEYLQKIANRPIDEFIHFNKMIMEQNEYKRLKIST